MKLGSKYIKDWANNIKWEVEIDRLQQRQIHIKLGVEYVPGQIE